MPIAMPPKPLPSPLPIDPLLPAVVAAVRSRGVAVLQAEPGAGKTTRVPLALLSLGTGEVWVVEPRRMAAVLAARHVAAELGEKAGDSVGYRVRLDEAIGPATRVVYATDGLLLRRLLADPHLQGIGAVVLDEFHERRLAGDLIAGVLRQLRRTARPDLALVVMSATLDAGEVAAWLDDAPVLHAPGRQFPVTVAHAAQLDQRPLEAQVASAVRRLVAATPAGDILVFLPGAAEIRRCERALGALAQQHDLALRPLHGSLAIADQERAIRPERQHKLILATNIAETSVTLPGVVAVVDSGLARQARHATWSGLPSLQVVRIGQAAAAQRAGRAGRVRAGQVERLYTQHDHDTRPPFEVPEIQRADLAECVLMLLALGIALDAPLWLTPPEPLQLAHALTVLQQLTAVTADARPTPTGRDLLRLPLDPRLGRLLQVAAELGHAAVGSTLAALLAQGAPTLQADPGRAAHGSSDLAVLLEMERQRPQPQVAETARQLRGLLARRAEPSVASTVDEALAQAALAAFPDRVAKRRQPGSRELELAGGRPARLDERSQVTEGEWLVAVDVEERRDGRTATTLVRLAQAFEPSRLLDLFPAEVLADVRLTWNPARGRVMSEERLLFRGLVLQESAGPARPSPQAAALLEAEALAAGLDTILDATELARLSERIDFARSAAALPLPAVDQALAAALREACEACTSLAELRAADVLGGIRRAIQAAAGGQGMALLNAAAPEQAALPGGRKVALHYPADQAPWLATRLQDFFGAAEGPKVAHGRVAVVLHLLAPNQRPVQVTSDLAGFWARHYPPLKKELARRYPKHAWPDDPLRAQPPPPRERK